MLATVTSRWGANLTTVSATDCLVSYHQFVTNLLFVLGITVRFNEQAMMSLRLWWFNRHEVLFA
jgi:hypothetical protein